MAESEWIELSTGERILIVYEDRSVLVIDKPAGWMLAPSSWQKKSGNLHRALIASIKTGDFWARSRNLNFLRFVHRLDAGTTGLLLLAKSPGALSTFSRLFQSRQMEKVYLAVVRGSAQQREWSCRLKLAPDPAREGRMCIDSRRGKEAETRFRVIEAGDEFSLIEARPMTGRMHQIRLHLAMSGHPLVGDELYGLPDPRGGIRLGLRAVGLAYVDPFTHRHVRIQAPTGEFVRAFGFEGAGCGRVLAACSITEGQI